MKTQFRIIVKMKVHNGLIEYGRLFLGDQKEFAKELFESLHGHHDPKSTSALRMDLIEEFPTHSILIDSKACNLEELTESFRMITREMDMVCQDKQLFAYHRGIAQVHFQYVSS